MPRLMHDYRRPGDTRKLSPFWIAVFSVGGKRVWKSTKVRIKPVPGLDTNADGSLKTAKQLKDKAWEQACAMEKALKAQFEGTLTEQNLRRILGNTDAVQHVLKPPTVEEWLDSWLKERRSGVSKSTLGKYELARDMFLDSLGPRRSARLDCIQSDDLVHFREFLLREGRAPQWADNIVRTILGAPFRLAFEQGRLPFNPLSALKPLPPDRAEREGFTTEELAQLLAAADTEWRGMILLGLHTGARLMDCATLKWSDVDLKERFIRLTPAKTKNKTGQTLPLPIHLELYEYLSTLEKDSEYIFPTLSKRRQGNLSRDFATLMKAARVSGNIVREKKGKVGRSRAARSFHSLRHSFNSFMANAGVPQEIRQRLTGHSSAKMNNIYTHLELQTFAAAVSKVPRITAPVSGTLSANENV